MASSKALGDIMWNQWFCRSGRILLTAESTWKVNALVTASVVMIRMILDKSFVPPYQRSPDPQPGGNKVRYCPTLKQTSTGPFIEGMAEFILHDCSFGGLS